MSLNQQKIEDLETLAVSEAREAIITLQEELSSLQTKSEAMRRERDMFRELLSSHGASNTGNAQSLSSNEHEQQLLETNKEIETKLQEVESSYEAFRNETNITIKTLNDQIDQLSNDKSSISVQLARAQSQLELFDERYKNLLENIRYSKSENEELQKRNNELQNTLSKQDIRTQQVAEDLVDAKSTSESLKSEIMNLRAEKSLWNSVEKRLNEDNKSLTEERTRLNSLVINLQNIQTDRERSESERQRRLENEIESIQSELKSSKKRLEDQTLELRALQLRKDFEDKASQDKINNLTNQLEKFQESIGSLQEQLQSKTGELKVTSQQLAALEKQQEETTSTVDETALRDQIKVLNIELESSRSQIESGNKNVEEFKNIASTAEEALQSMTESFDEYKLTTEGKLKEAESRLSYLNEELEAVNKKLKETQRQSGSSIEALQKERNNLISENTNLSSEVSKLNQNNEGLRSDLGRQAEISKQAEINYQEELMKHANSSKQYQELKAEYNKFKEELQETRNNATRAESILQSSQSSWDSQKSALNEEISNLKNRAEDLVSQNQLLHNQLEILTANNNKDANKSDSFTPAADTIDGSTEEFRDIIRFLRREKEIVDTQLEVSVQEAKRLKQRLDHTTSTLEETRMELVKERQRGDDTLRQNAAHEELLEKINQLNILRESNGSLRTENEHKGKRLVELTKEIDRLQTAIEPLKSK